MIEFTVDEGHDSLNLRHHITNETELQRSASSIDCLERVLYIGNIPKVYQECELKQLFSGFGRIISFTIVKSRRRSSNPGNFLYGFVTYENARSAAALLDCVNVHKKKYSYRGCDLVIKKRDR